MERPSAYKRLLTHPEWIIPLIITIILLWVCNDKTFGLPPIITWLGYLSAVILIISVLQNICCADEFYKIRSDKKTIRKIYLYTSGFFTTHQTVNMVIVGDDYLIQKKILPHGYEFNEWDDFSSFLFCTEENIYYYSSPFYEAEPLGYSWSATAFYNPRHPNRMIVLDGQRTLTIEADVFFLNGVFIPALASQDIRDEDTDDLIETPNKYLCDYLIAKKGKIYSVYGLYYDKHPLCRRLQIPTIIFKEGYQDVILKWIDNYGYSEFYHTKYSVKRKVSDTFVELTYQNGIGGTVRKFNEQTGQLDIFYKGYFHAIDFDSGAIIGDNGYRYTPED